MNPKDRVRKWLPKHDGDIMPAEVMLKHTRYHHGRWHHLLSKPPHLLVIPADPEAKAAAIEANEKAVAKWESMIDHHDRRAIDCAKAAAPFYHPTLAAVAVTPGAAGNLTLEQILRASFPEPAVQPEADGPVMIEASVNRDEDKP